MFGVQNPMSKTLSLAHKNEVSSLAQSTYALHHYQGDPGLLNRKILKFRASEVTGKSVYFYQSSENFVTFFYTILLVLRKKTYIPQGNSCLLLTQRLFLTKLPLAMSDIK